MEIRNRRVDYRVRYPDRLRPTLEWEGAALSVFDLSEGGIRFSRGDDLPLHTGDHLEARIRLPHGVVAPLAGFVLRTSDIDVAVRLEHGVSFQTILAQRDLVSVDSG
ncbi:PilZ domain-containing protein [Nevskia soli]|uniref:PilZ domain-containing protein n=1 Tax=Nevskia soli TaxID=418856 RepID=UPI000A03A500|nr:PilZ domain-containing protein [Nevskia soli]